ncbi:MAG TPA: FtsX-like permease family protein [Symbiobacteriaceae bacterium]|nr:FtsX-like permease family protein [Symbiobacteriaceae bacterium]
MRAVLRKVAADLKGRPWQSALIAVTVAAAATLLYLGLVTLTTVSSPYEKLMDRTRGAHAFMLLEGADRGRALADRLSALPGVTESAYRPALMTTLKLPAAQRSADVILMEVEPGKLPMMGYTIVEGRDLAAPGAGEAVLGVSEARYFGLQVGDQVEVIAARGTVTLRLVGLHADPMWCAYPMCDIQNLYVLPGTLEPAAMGSQAMFGVRLADPESAGTILAAAHRDAGETRLLTAWTWLQVRRGIQLTNGLTVLSVLIFAIVAIFASALITANIIGGAVLGQYRELAVLKVLGFTRWQVLGLYVGQNMLLGLGGALAGVGAGHAVAVRILRSLAETMSNPDLLRWQWWAAAAVVCIVLLISGCFATLAAWRAVRMRPAMVLQEGFAQPRTRVGLLVRGLTRLRAPAPVVLGVKDAVARPARAVLTVVSVALCLLTIAMSAGLGDLVEQMRKDPSDLGVPYDLWAGDGKAPAGQTEAALAGMDGVEFYAPQAWLPVSGGEKGVGFALRALDGEWRRFAFQVVRGRLPSAPGEVALGPGAMAELGANPGDSLEMRVGGLKVMVTVVGEYLDPLNLGMMGLTTVETLRAVWPEVPVKSYLVKLRPGIDAEAVRTALLSATEYRAAAVLSRSFLLPPPILDLLGRMRTLSLLMAGIAVLSLLNSVLLTAREQMREVGLRKAVGMTPAQILGAVAAGSAYLGLLGSAVGIPLGMMLWGTMLESLARTNGYGAVSVGLSAVSAGLLLVGGGVVAVVCGMPAAVWAGRVRTASVLSAE